MDDLTSVFGLPSSHRRGRRLRASRFQLLTIIKTISQLKINI
jgi:hypothetical protein